jgi:AcrR family transcriptional regulator
VARRTGLSRAEIQSSALSAGRDLIVQHGLKKFSMRQVAEQIGYTVGTLYNVFKNQDDLLLQINTITLAELREYIKTNLNKNLQGRDILLSVATSYYAFAAQNYSLWTTLFEYSLSEESSLPAWYAENINALVDLAERSLSGLSLSETEIKVASRTLWASVHGICALSLSGKLHLTASPPAEILINDLIDKYFRALTCEQ